MPKFQMRQVGRVWLKPAIERDRPAVIDLQAGVGFAVLTLAEGIILRDLLSDIIHELETVTTTKREPQ
jgi:hypothetical protein